MGDSIGPLLRTATLYMTMLSSVDVALVLHVVLEAIGAAIFAASSAGVEILPAAAFAPGPALVALRAQGAMEALLVLRIAALAIFSTALLALGAYTGPSPSQATCWVCCHFIT